MTHVRHCTLFAFALACGLALSSPQVALADDDANEKLAGTYELATSRDQAREKINEEIDELVEDVSFIKRSFARSRLRDKTEPCAEIEIDFPDDDVSVQCGDDPAAVSPPDDQPTDYTADDGETYRLRQNVSGRTLTQRFTSDEGTRTNRLRFSEGKDAIDMKVTVESDQLPRPLEYSLRFTEK